MFMKTKKALAALLALCMVAGMLPAAAIAAEVAEPQVEAAAAATQVREYHVPYANLDAIRAYSGQDLSSYQCTEVKFSFINDYWPALPIAKTWSAAPTPVDTHQPESLTSVEFVFYCWWKVDSITVSIPANELDIAVYAEQDGKLNFAEIAVKTEPSVPEVIMYDVTFDANNPEAGEEPYACLTMEEGSLIAEDARPADPVYADHTFTGWYSVPETAADGDQEAANSFNFGKTPIVADITIYAHWTENQQPPVPERVPTKYSVNCEFYTGSKIEPQYLYDIDNDVITTCFVGDIVDPASFPKNLTYKGIFDENEKDYRLIETDPSTKLVLDGTGTQKITLRYGQTALPQPTTYTVTFHASYPDSTGADYAKVTVEDGSAVTAPTEPTYEGYTFKGWFDDMAGLAKASFDFKTPIHADMVLTAHWGAKPVEPVPATYTLTHAYYLDNVLVKETVKTAKGFVNGQIAPQGVKLYHPEFRGNDYSYTSADPAEGILLDNTGKQHLTLRYDFTTPDTGSIVLTYSYVTDGIANAVPAPAGVNPPKTEVAQHSFRFDEQARPGYGSGDYSADYAFSGWYNDKTCKNPVGIRQVVGETTTVYGYWTGPAPIVPDPEPTPDPKPTPDPQPEPDYSYYRATVRYLEEGSERVLADEYRTNSILEGGKYDVTDKAALTISGYTIASVEGEVSGRLNNNRTITVWYAPEAVITEPETPLTDLPETEVTDIPEPQLPLADLPATEDAATEGNAPADASSEIIIVDEAAPLGNLPQTGTVAAPVVPQWTLGLMALLGSMVAAGLAAIAVRKREDDAE